METISENSLGALLRMVRRWARWPRTSSARSVRTIRLAVETLEDRCGPCDLLAGGGGALIPAAATQSTESAPAGSLAAPLAVHTSEIPGSSTNDHSTSPAGDEEDSELLPPVAMPASQGEESQVRDDALRIGSNLPFAGDWPTLDTLFSVPNFGADGLGGPLAHPLSLLGTEDWLSPDPRIPWPEMPWTDPAPSDQSFSAPRTFSDPILARYLPPLTTVNWAFHPGASFAFASQGALPGGAISSRIGATQRNDFPEPAANEPTPPPDAAPDPGSEVADLETNDPGNSDIEAAAVVPPAENYAAMADGPKAQAGSLVSSRSDIVAVPPRHSPVVTPSVVSSSLGGNGAASPDSFFRVSRTPVVGTALEVHYTLSSFSGSGIVNHSGATIIDGGAAHAELAPFAKTACTNGPEVVVFQLRAHRDYRLGKSGATWFPAASRNGASETALFEAYRHGNSGEAFNVLVERHRDAVYQTCFRLLGNRHDTEDLMQLVFLALAKRQVRLQTTLAGWLRMVARNTCLTFLRAKRRRARHEQQAARLDVWCGDDTPELREELEAALNQVCPPLREAVRLRYLDGWSQHEAARIVGCPRGTLAQRAAKGVSSLRDLLAARGHLLG